METADLPTGPREPRPTTLSVAEEAIVVDLRWHTLLPLDDCLDALQATIPVRRLCVIVGRASLQLADSDPDQLA